MDQKERLLVPDLVSHQMNRVFIKPKDLPINYELQEKEKYIEVGQRSGTRVFFSAFRFMAVEGSLYILLPDGSKEFPHTGGSILLVVGPEGGFDRDESFLFEQAGATVVSLGARRLRSETAAIAGIVKVLVVNHIL